MKPPEDKHTTSLPRQLVSLHVNCRVRSAAGLIKPVASTDSARGRSRATHSPSTPTQSGGANRRVGSRTRLCASDRASARTRSRARRRWSQTSWSSQNGDCGLVSAWQPSAEQVLAASLTSSSRPQSRHSRDRVVGRPQRLHVIGRYSYQRRGCSWSWLQRNGRAWRSSARRDSCFRAHESASGASVPTGKQYRVDHNTFATGKLI